MDDMSKVSEAINTLREEDIANKLVEDMGFNLEDESIVQPSSATENELIGASLVIVQPIEESATGTSIKRLENDLADFNKRIVDLESKKQECIVQIEAIDDKLHDTQRAKRAAETHLDSLKQPSLRTTRKLT